MEREGETSDNPRDLAIWTELHELIELLPTELLVVVDLMWYHELSHEEAAEVLHWSPATVKRRWRAARRLLRRFVLGEPTKELENT